MSDGPSHSPLPRPFPYSDSDIPVLEMTFESYYTIPGVEDDARYYIMNNHACYVNLEGQLVEDNALFERVGSSCGRLELYKIECTNELVFLDKYTNEFTFNPTEQQFAPRPVVQHHGTISQWL